VIIPRPTHNDYFEPTPSFVPDEDERSNTRRCAWVKWFFSLTPWKCHVCGAKIVATVDYCVCCKFMRHKHVSRIDPPTSQGQLDHHR